MMLPRATILLASLVILSPAYAGPVPEEAPPMPPEGEEEMLSAGELLKNCEEGASPGNPNQYCMRYVFGLVQVVDSFQRADPSQQVFCIDPNKLSLQEVTETATDYLKSKSDRLDEDAYKLVTEALHASYPCNTSSF